MHLIALLIAGLVWIAGSTACVVSERTLAEPQELGYEFLPALLSHCSEGPGPWTVGHARVRDLQFLSGPPQGRSFGVATSTAGPLTFEAFVPQHSDPADDLFR